MAYMAFVKTIVGNLLSRPATRRYPFVTRPPFAATRGSVVIEIDKCIFCGLCQRKCPTDAIAVSKPEKAWSIDRLRCIACAACVEACPKDCLTMSNAYAPAVTGKKVDRFELKAPAQAPDAESAPSTTAKSS